MRTEVNGLRLQIQKYGEVDGTQGFRKAITSTMALEKKKKKSSHSKCEENLWAYGEEVSAKKRNRLKNILGCELNSIWF